jgi:hypothetical protein
VKQYYKIKNRPEEICVSTSYTLGRIASERGYYISVQPVIRSGGLVSYCPTDGYRKILIPVNRQSARAASQAEHMAGLLAEGLAKEMARDNGWQLEID